MPQNESVKEAKRLQAFWRPRNEKWLHHRELLAGTYRKQVPKYVMILSNGPQVLVDLSVAVVASDPPEIRIPILQEDASERKSMNKTERFLSSVYQLWNHNHRNALHGDWLEEAAWYTFMGAVALFPHMVKTGRSGLDFRCDVFDPMDVYPDLGTNGTGRVSRIYNTTVADAKGMAKRNGWNDADDALSRLGSDEDELEVINDWYMEDDKVWNAISFLTSEGADSIDVLNPIHRKEFDEIPLKIYGSNGVPYRAFSNTKQPEGGNGTLPDWRAQWGRSILDANEDIYKAIDSMLTWEGQVVHDTAYGTYLHTTQSGMSSIVGKDISLQDLQVIAGKQGDTLTPVNPPTTPSERQELFAYLRGAEQRGGVSDVATGQLGLEVSGVTLDQLISSTTGKHRPYVNTLTSAISDAMMVTQKLFKGQKRKIDLNRVDADLGFYHEAFEPSDIPTTTGVKVTLSGAILDKTLQTLTNMQIALPGQSLMDYVTAAEQIGHKLIPDAAVVKERIAQDQMEQDPRVQAAKIRTAMRKRITELTEVATEAALAEAEELQRILDNDVAVFRQQTALADNRNSPSPKPPGPRPEVPGQQASPLVEDNPQLTEGDVTQIPSTTGPGLQLG